MKHILSMGCRIGAGLALLLLPLLWPGVGPSNGQPASPSCKFVSFPPAAESAPDALRWLSRMADFTPLPRYSFAAPLSAQIQPAVKVVLKNNAHHDPRNLYRDGLPQQTATLDAFATVLSAADAQRYRNLFALLAAGQLSDVAALSNELENDVLLGYVQARFYLHPRQTNLNYADLAEWLEEYGDLPYAQQIYAKAMSLHAQADALPQMPTTLAGLSGNVEKASGAGALDWKQNRMLSIAHHVREHEKEGAGIAAAAQTANPSENWLKGLDAWRNGDAQGAQKLFSNLAQDASLPAGNKAAAAFWAARSAEKQGNAEIATRYLQMAAASAPRSFYGMLAQAKMGVTPEFNWQNPVFNARSAAALKANPIGERALALLQIGEKQLAEDELRRLHPDGDDQLEQSLLALSERGGMPALALQLGNALTRDNATTYDAALYPIMPWQPRGGYASDAALVMAVARNESRFDANARNPTGASGIMQLMPETAAKMSGAAVANLMDPETNVRLGDQYIKKLARLDGIEGDLLRLIAAYNCGPGKLQQWVSTNEKQGNDPLLFIERMPLKETRDYMQKVLTTYWAYRARLGKPLTALAELAGGAWPQLAMEGKMVENKISSTISRTR